MTHAATIHALRKRLECIERAHRTGDRHRPDGISKSGRVFTTGWRQVDDALGGGFPAGALHEWFGPSDEEDLCASRRARWTPPLCALIHLAWRVLGTGPSHRRVLWIGSRLFPYPWALVRPQDNDRRLLERSLFVSAKEVNARLWASALALRCPAADLVITDGSSFSMAATRRLQLLAQEHDTPALLVRPPWERGELSAAQSRWLMRRMQSTKTPPDMFRGPRWSVELLRCKGRLIEIMRGPWTLEWDGDTSTLRLSSEVAHSASASQKREGRTHRTPQSA